MSRQGDYVVDGGVALVTGAASGIGAALADRLVRDGSNLALVDRNEEGLHEVAERLRVRRPDRRITVMVADLAAESAPAEVVERSLAEHGRLTLVVNNAGVALAGRFEQVSVADVDWLLAINLRSVLAVTSAALPHLSPGSHITNVSSLFGIVAPVGNAVYSASKFGVRGFSMSLRTELAPRGIGVTTVYPGGIKTAIARQARRGSGVSEKEWEAGLRAYDRFLVIEPSDAARKIAEGTVRRRARVLIGPETYAGDLLARLAPTGHSSVFEYVARKRAGM
ncbi:MAG: SDR family NAD(P)-dependent oxidoreductase [Candidatus Nanopelagicales bacterium]